MNFKKRIRISALLLLAVFLVSASVQAQQGKFKKNAINRNYNTATVETVSGTVTAVTNVSSWGLHITVKTADGTIGVHLGPEWFLKDKISVATNDAVTVIGSRVKQNGADVIIAKSIQKGNITVELRDDNGIPKWSGKGKKRFK